jgi:predicted ATP-dependent serine protease
MVYHCQDCSYQGAKRSAGGHCPACGSPNFRLRERNKQAEEKKSGKGSLLILALLWGYLIVHVYWKLTH